ncbi:MAG: hypothetical protein A3C55_04390 [Gammaproteobacteria bacterium RIFCSPHIGHO2_02_FULL_42_13]|nr:MAG: hypothetical protein A3C55_04390 [Gammaproteobacteria bacterium RIFCSPHIGHO2_02_FULL_42_13]OGT70749.1 MAG: hypothetical protein A3H43_05075 [Gammaproteobacteria bacterium RIFCSPLOWO2_02_FULL_42_9]
MKQPALGMIEFKSIARGIATTDAVVKKAPVTVVTTNPICPGKYMLIFAGFVADVEESLKAGLELGGDLVINHLFIPNLHHDIIPALSGTTKVKKFGAIGIVETFSVVSCVMAADKAAKIAHVQLIEIRLANGLGGKGYFVLTGELADVESAVEVAKAHVQQEGLLAASEVIPAPHKELIEKGLYW